MRQQPARCAEEKGAPNVAEAIRLIRAAGATDSAATLRDERSVFQDMRVGEDAFALRYLFFLLNVAPPR